MKMASHVGIIFLAMGLPVLAACNAADPSVMPTPQPEEIAVVIESFDRYSVGRWDATRAEQAQTCDLWFHPPPKGVEVSTKLAWMGRNLYGYAEDSLEGANSYAGYAATLYADYGVTEPAGWPTLEQYEDLGWAVDGWEDYQAWLEWKLGKPREEWDRSYKSADQAIIEEANDARALMVLEMVCEEYR